MSSDKTYFTNLFSIVVDVLLPSHAPGGAQDFEMGGGVRREATNAGCKERILGKNRG